jgi:hypothetical protein
MWWNSVVKLWEYQCRSVFRCYSLQNHWLCFCLHSADTLAMAYLSPSTIQLFFNLELYKLAMVNIKHTIGLGIIYGPNTIQLKWSSFSPFFTT